jgi:NTP pyrophosphatase (non-canonical NTP hydrolase)
MYDNVFDNLAINLHEVAVEKGFWPEPDAVDDIFIAKQCMMIVSEVTEVMEAIRKDKGEEEITKEFADILIRTLDLYAGAVEAGYTRLSLDQALREKVDFNKTRPEKHGVRF